MRGRLHRSLVINKRVWLTSELEFALEHIGHVMEAQEVS